jgi:hypothetical protein
MSREYPKRWRLVMFWLPLSDRVGRSRSVLERKIIVIPVLVEDAAMPVTRDLPEDLQPLARRIFNSDEVLSFPLTRNRT